MKNNKVKAKKGMTLIEVIISVALLSILIVPLLGLVMSSLKNNISAEYRQKASYIGQKVLEELKAYDKITLKNDLIVPLLGLVMSSLKNNISAEYRQKASYIGQKVLEELKAYDKITLKNDAGKKYFELLDGDESNV